jgi:hypothetical protein
MGGTDAVVPEGDGNRWCMRTHGLISTLSPNTLSFKDKPSTKPSRKLHRNHDSDVLSSQTFGFIFKHHF